MTTFHLKLLAVLTMVVDHVGLIFFPHILYFRVIGRLSFLIFCFLLANGFSHTHSKSSYLKRLFIFSVLSEIPYLLVSRLENSSFLGLNVLFTFFLGLGLLAVLEKIKRGDLKLLTFLGVGIAALVLNVDYGVMGIFSIYLFYRYLKNYKKMILSQMMLYFSFYTVPIILQYLTSTGPTFAVNQIWLYQPVALLSLIPIYFYNQKLGPRTHYFLYIFYPVHLTLLYLIKISLHRGMIR